MKIGDMLNDPVTSTEETISPEGLANSTAKILPTGTLLISIFATIGRTAILGVPAATNQAIVGVKPRADSDLDVRYLRRFLDYSVGVLAGQARGVAQANVNGAILKSLKIPLPPLPEQKRIADILDKADAIRRKRREAVKAASSLLVSSFIELFGDVISNPRTWPTAQIGDVSRLVTSGVTPRGGAAVYEETGPYFIRSQNVLMNRLDLSDAAHLPLDIHESMRRTKVSAGDVLLNITGASIGRVTWVESLDREANVNQHVCIIRPEIERIAAPYLSVALSLPTSQELINRIQSGASRQGLNHQQVRSLTLPIPPRQLQSQFERIVHKLRVSQACLDSLRGESETLFNSLVQRAFRGEL